MRARGGHAGEAVGVSRKVDGTTARRDRDRIAIFRRNSPVIGSPEAGAARIKLHQKGVRVTTTSITRLMHARGGNAAGARGISRKVNGTIARRDRYRKAFFPSPPP
jgi:hypothetical protein